VAKKRAVPILEGMTWISGSRKTVPKTLALNTNDRAYVYMKHCIFRIHSCFRFRYLGMTVTY